MRLKILTKKRLFMVGSYFLAFFIGCTFGLFIDASLTNPKTEPTIGGTAKDWRNSK